LTRSKRRSVWVAASSFQLCRAWWGGKTHWPVRGSWRPSRSSPEPGDADPDQHEGDVHAHQRPDQVKGVLVGLAVQPLASRNATWPGLSIELGRIVLFSSKICKEHQTLIVQIWSLTSPRGRTTLAAV
jgi:hypothetical protein